MSTSSTNSTNSITVDTPHTLPCFRPKLKLDTNPTAINVPLGLANEEGLYDTVEWGRRPTNDYYTRVKEKWDRQYNSMFKIIKELCEDKKSLQKELGRVDAESWESWKKGRILANEAREKDKEINELRSELNAARRKMTALSEDYDKLVEDHKKAHEGSFESACRSGSASRRPCCCSK